MDYECNCGFKLNDNYLKILIIAQAFRQAILREFLNIASSEIFYLLKPANDYSFVIRLKTKTNARASVCKSAS